MRHRHWSWLTSKQLRSTTAIRDCQLVLNAGDTQVTPTPTGLANSPAAPALLTSRPHRSCRPYWIPIILPLGIDPSTSRFASAHSHACRRTSSPAARPPRTGAGDLTATGAVRNTAEGTGVVDRVPDAARRAWRIESSYDPISANDGHAAIYRPVIEGSATATFAARLAKCRSPLAPTAAHHPRLPDLESASSVVDAATIMPSTDNGVSAATQPGWPCRATSRCMCR